MSDMEMPKALGEDAGASSQHPPPQKRPGEEGGGDGGGAQLKKRPGTIKEARGGGSAEGVIIINDEPLPLVEAGLAERKAEKLPEPWERVVRTRAKGKLPSQAQKWGVDAFSDEDGEENLVYVCPYCCLPAGKARGTS